MSELQQVYEEYRQQLYRFLLNLTGDPDLAEELLQETFYQELIHIGKFEGRSSLYTWLCRIGKNAWLKECRRGQRVADTPWEELRLPNTDPTPEESTIQKEQLKQIRRAIRHLEEPYKEVFILHVFGGLKLKEIAVANDKSESWARVTYYRARLQIAKEVME